MNKYFTWLYLLPLLAGCPSDPVAEDAPTASDAPAVDSATLDAGTADAPGAEDAPTADDAPATTDAPEPMSDAGPMCTDTSCAHGTCSVDTGSVVCDCTGTGFSGADCSVPAPISINFDDAATLMADVAAGRTPTTGWNNARGAGPGQGDEGMLADLTDESTAASGVSVSWTCQDIEVTPLTDAATGGDRTMMSLGCRSWLGMGDATITLAGLAAHFPDGYQMVVYIGHGGGFPTDHRATFSLAVGASTTVTGAVLPNFSGTWDDLTGGTDGGNIYVAPVATEDGVVLTLRATGAARLPTAAINGIQIFAAP